MHLTIAAAQKRPYSNLKLKIMKYCEGDMGFIGLQKLVNAASIPQLIKQDLLFAFGFGILVVTMTG